MTSNPYDRIAELGKELEQLASEMRDETASIREGHRKIAGPAPDYTKLHMGEARVIGIAAELRVIVAGHKGV